MKTVYFHLSEKSVQTFVNANCVNVTSVHKTLKKKPIIYQPYATDFDVSILDEDKMMAHILECYAALCAAQQWRNRRDKEEDNFATQKAKNKAFKIAMSVMSQGIRHDDADLPNCGPALPKIVDRSEKKSDGRSWIPLQWATVAFETPIGDLFGLTEDDVHLLHANDPLAFARCLGSSNPAQLLCMQ